MNLDGEMKRRYEGKGGDLFIQRHEKRTGIFLPRITRIARIRGQIGERGKLLFLFFHP